tara:strand:- start:435 stop:611 length:177 start_codon:yes stop_codon:yes gene_type:complete
MLKRKTKKAKKKTVNEIMDILNNPSKYSKAVYQSAIRSFGTMQRKTFANKGKLIRKKK